MDCVHKSCVVPALIHTASNQISTQAPFWNFFHTLYKSMNQHYGTSGVFLRFKNIGYSCHMHVHLSLKFANNGGS